MMMSTNLRFHKSYTYYFNLGFDNLLMIKFVAVKHNVFVENLVVSVKKLYEREGKERKGKGSEEGTSVE